MPELAFSTWHGFILARTSERVVESAVWAQAGWRAHADALVHVPDHFWVFTLFRQTCASAHVIFPVLVFTACIWLRGAKTLAELDAPEEIDAI